jgi:hypothetical protein
MSVAPELCYRKHTEIQICAAVGIFDGVVTIVPLVNNPELGSNPYIRELAFGIALDIGACVDIAGSDPLRNYS